MELKLIEINNIEDLRKAHPSLNITWQEWCGEKPFKENEHVLDSNSCGKICCNKEMEVWFCNTCKVYTVNNVPYMCNLLETNGIIISIVNGEVYFLIKSYNVHTSDFLYIEDVIKYYKKFKVKNGDSKILKIVKKHVQKKLLECWNDERKNDILTLAN